MKYVDIKGAEISITLAHSLVSMPIFAGLSSLLVGILTGQTLLEIMKRFLLLPMLGTFGVSLLFSQEDTSTFPEEYEEDIYQLSPFVVSTDSEMGYVANSTLAGTRIKTDLKDVGASVSIYTQEFLEDVDGNDLETILKFTTGTEVAGADGNFSGAFSGEDNAEQRVETSRNNRVRGLARATLTRNYFATDIPFDRYNSDELTIVRGPNSLLAGSGSPGGIINSSSRNAAFNDSTSLGLRYGKNDSYRGVINLNREVIEDRLAVRVDLLSEKRNFRQEPAYEQDERISVGVNAVLFEGNRGFLGRTSIRANYEDGKIEGNPPNPLPPLMSTQAWFDDTDVGKWYYLGHNKTWMSGENASGSYNPNEEFTWGMRPNSDETGYWTAGWPLYRSYAVIYSEEGSSNPIVGLGGSLAQVQGFQGTLRGGRQYGNLVATGDPNRNRAGYSRTRLQNRNVFDFYNHMLTGDFDFRSQEFDALNIAVEQLFWNGKAGLEFAYDLQSYDLAWDIPIRGENAEVFIDVNQTLSVRDDNGDPITNPNFGRPFVVTRGAFSDQIRDRERETSRLTAFVGHDFRDNLDGILGKIIGKHTLSLLYQKTTNDFVSEGATSGWPAVTEDGFNIRDAIGLNPGAWAMQVNAWFYLGDSVINASSQDEIRLNPIRTARPEVTDSYLLRVQNGVRGSSENITVKPRRITSWYQRDEEEFESTAFALQSHLLDDHLISMISYREDVSNRSIGQFGPERDILGDGDLTRENWILLTDPELTIGSWTKSIVAVFPEDYLFELPLDMDLRLFWNQSENFTPVGARRDIYNNDIGPPRGETEEFGAAVSLFNGKLDLRATWYETKVTNSSVSAGPNPYGYIQTMMTRLVDAHNAGEDINDPEHKWNTFGFASYVDAANAFYGALPSDMRVGPEFQFNPVITDTGNGIYEMSPDSIPNYASTSQTVSDGFELEAVLNPTSNWRIALSVAKQEAVRADVGRQQLDWVGEFEENLRSAHGEEIFQGSRNPGQNSGAWHDQYYDEHVFKIRAENAKSGTSLPEMSKWRASVVTRYTFRDGLLKNFRIGGSARWMDKAAIGYPNITDEVSGLSIADIANPYFGEDDFRADFNIGYKRKVELFGQNIDWDISLYVSNLIGSQDLIATKANPDGSIGQVRVAPERFWSLNSSFSF